jgi:trehalose-phosphatase
MIARTGSAHSQHLFERWRTVRARLKRAGEVALFLDFDGTLTPLRDHPREAELSHAVRRLLRRLAQHPRLTVCIISGRRSADLRKRVGVPGVCCIGLHGGERDGHLRLKPQTLKVLERTRRDLEEHLRRLEGLWVEDKLAGFVVHYQKARPEMVRRAWAMVRKVLKPLGSLVRVLHGIKVWEILPEEIKGKGEAVRELLSEVAHLAVAIYVGDDITDESAFAALPRGVTIRVGTGRPTRARYELRNTEEVQEFLERLVAEIS